MSIGVQLVVHGGYKGPGRVVIRWAFIMVANVLRSPKAISILVAHIKQRQLWRSFQNYRKAFLIVAIFLTRSISEQYNTYEKSGLCHRL
jgi:hypothetical protein